MASLRGRRPCNLQDRCQQGDAILPTPVQQRDEPRESPCYLPPMPRVLTTGATGFLGKAVTDGFLAAGWSVAALTPDPDSARTRSPTSVTTHASTGVPAHLN